MKRPAKSAPAGYDALLEGVVDLLAEARRSAGRAVNAVLTLSYWEIGRRIVDQEQNGKKRAQYGQQLMERLSLDLTARFGRGFSLANIFQMRQFYLLYREKLPAASPKFEGSQILQTLSGKFEAVPFPFLVALRPLAFGP